MITIPTRQQIARVVANDQAMMRALEEIFRSTNINTSDLDGQGVDVGAAAASAGSASAIAIAAADLAALAAMAPAYAPVDGGLSVAPVAVDVDQFGLADVAPATFELIGV